MLDTLHSEQQKWRKDGDFRVCVLEGNYVELAEAGAPILVCLQMQQLELSLGKAQWSTRQTCGRFSHVAGQKHEERRLVLHVTIA